MDARMRRWLTIGSVGTVAVCAVLWFSSRSLSRRELISGQVLPSRFVSLTVYACNVEGSGTDLIRTARYRRAPSVTLTSDEVRGLFSHCTFVDTKTCLGKPLWKGSFLGVAHTADGRDCYLKISVYGHFFAIIGDGGYYRCKEESERAFYRLREKVLTEAEKGVRSHFDRR